MKSNILLQIKNSKISTVLSIFSLNFDFFKQQTQNKKKSSHHNIRNILQI